MTTDLASVAAGLARRCREAILAFPPTAFIWRHWRVEYGFLLLFAASLLIAWVQINTPFKYPDFTVFHAAASHADGPVYDSGFLTQLQDHGVGEARPFAYPPTFLLLILPLGLLSFKIAFSLWVATSVTAYIASGWRMSRASWIALWSPTFLFVAMIGQTSLLVGAIAIAAFLALDRKPALAGFAFGLVACIKPQALLLLPLFLLFDGYWRAVGFAALTVAVGAVAATLRFGGHIWGQWIGSISSFVALNDKAGIDRLGLPPSSPDFYLCAAAALTFLWLYRRGPPANQALAVLGGSMLLSPHAAFYEVAILIVPLLAAAGWSWRLVPALLLCFADGVGPVTLGIGLLLVLLPFPAISSSARSRSPSSAGHSRPPN